MKTFAQEWAKQRGGESAIERQRRDYFQRVGYPNKNYSSSHTRTRHRTPLASTYKPIRTPLAPAPVWSEFLGMSSQQGYTYSPALFKIQHQHAMQVFAQAEYVLSKAKAHGW